ncbi:hypothetical protein D3C84_1030580 [compost metagenome]
MISPTSAPISAYGTDRRNPVNTQVNAEGMTTMLNKSRSRAPIRRRMVNCSRDTLRTPL